MDKTPKERIVFDESVYYGAEGSEDGHRPL